MTLTEFDLLLAGIMWGFMFGHYFGRKVGFRDGKETGFYMGRCEPPPQEVKEKFDPFECPKRDIHKDDSQIDYCTSVSKHGDCMTSCPWPVDDAGFELEHKDGGEEPTYPCDKCGKARTVAEGGTTFTVCDECWDRKYAPGLREEIEDAKPTS